MLNGLAKKSVLHLRFSSKNSLVFLASMSDSRNSEFHDVATYKLADLQKDQEALRTLIGRYQNAPSTRRLKELVFAGWDAYRTFLNGFHSTSDVAKRFWEDFVKTRRSHGAPILWMTALDGLTIPIALYYLENPKNISDWDDFPRVARNFAGVDFPIRKIYKRRQRLEKRIDALCRSDERPRVAHSVDKSLPYAAKEADSWKLLDATPIPAQTAKLLVEAWTSSNPSANIIHCSCHLKRDSNQRSYLTCGENEKVYVNDLLDGGSKIDSPPFVFINSCNGGVVSAADRDNFVWSLFPGKSVGFISTICEVKDELANAFSQQFYRNFNGGAEILLALHQAISTLVLEEQKLGALAYTLWEADPHLLLHDAEP